MTRKCSNCGRPSSPESPIVLIVKGGGICAICAARSHAFAFEAFAEDESNDEKGKFG